MKTERKEEVAQRLYDALKRIASYSPTERVKRGAEAMGLDENEAVEMAYENVIQEAKNATHGLRRPKITTTTTEEILEG